MSLGGCPPLAPQLPCEFAGTLPSLSDLQILLSLSLPLPERSCALEVHKLTLPAWHACRDARQSRAPVDFLEVQSRMLALIILLRGDQ